MIPHGVGLHPQPIPVHRVVIISPLQHIVLGSITKKCPIGKIRYLMPIIPAKTIPAIFTSTSGISRVAAHIVDLDAVKRHFLHQPFQVFPVHVKESRVIMAKRLVLILLRIAPAAIPQIHFAKVLVKMSLILCMPGRNRVRE